MKAMVYRHYGPPESMELTELADPSPGPDQVLVQVRHAGVNPVDWKIGEGRMKSFFECEFPLVVGRELAGVVLSAGNGVMGFSEGDEVFAALPRPGGAFAEYVALHADHVSRAPARISPEESASLPLVALTCWQCLAETAELGAGQTVFVLAGAGGTGSLAVQIARVRGATVLAACGPGNRDYVKSLGANEVFDYSTDDVVAEIRRRIPEGVDVVFSNVLGELHRQAYGAVRKNGVLVTIGESLIPGLAEEREIRALDVVVRPSGEQLREIASLVDRGALRPPEITRLDLEQCAKALRMSMDGHVRGKIVLRVS